MNAATVSFALRCAADGVILEVLGGRSQPPRGVGVGRRLQELVPSGAQAPIRIMLGALRERPIVLCRPFEFGTVGDTVSGYLSGGRHGDSYLLAFAGSAEESAHIYEDFLGELGEAPRTAPEVKASAAGGPKELADVMEALGEGMVIQAPSGAVIACNDRAHALLGLGLDEIEHWQSADPAWRLESETGESLAGASHPALEALRNGESVTGRTARVTYPDGSSAWIAMGARPLFHPGEREPYAVACSLRDVSEMVALRGRLRGEGMWDDLTGLHSQPFLLVRIEAELAAFNRYGHPVSLGLCIIDDFDALVAAEGAAVAEEVLKEVARRLKQGTRGSDVIVHVGGSEFCLLLPYTVTVDGGRCAERLRQAVSSSPITLSDERVLSITVSLGVAGASPGTDVEKLAAAADKALDEARSLGVNRVFVALDQG